MIAYLTGQLLEQSEHEIVILCRGIGYQVHCSQNTLDDLAGKKMVRLWIHHHIKEGVSALYGFSKPTEKKLFLSLLKVNGVGPKLAIGALSGAPLAQIIAWIDGQDVKGLTNLPKVGKKTAEQMILTLKGKLMIDREEQGHLEFPNHQQEVLSALLNLGFSNSRAEDAIKKLPRDVEFEEGVRESLRELSGLA